MIRAGFVLPIFAALALSRPARAEDTAPRLPLLGAQFSLSGGASFAMAPDAVNAELTRAGRPELPSVLPALQIRFGLMLYDVTLDVHFGGSDVGLADTAGSGESLHLYRRAIGVDLGYRLRLGHGLSLSPYVGVGSIDSTLCFAGHPDAASWTSRPAFEQIARNPGRNACLEASDIDLDVGLSSAWNLRLAPRRREPRGGVVSYLSLGPRVGYTLPLLGDRTWQESSSPGLRTELPPFEGPRAPLGGVYAGIELQVRFETE